MEFHCFLEVNHRLAGHTVSETLRINSFTALFTLMSTALFTLMSSGCSLSVQLGGINKTLMWLSSRI